QPRVLAVGVEGSARIPVGPQLLGLRRRGVGPISTGNVTDDLDATQQLDTAQLEVVVAGIDRDAHARITHEVRPALALDDRVQPQGGAAPYEPQWRHVRRTGAVDTSEPAHVLDTEERVELVLVHRDPATALLLFHRQTVSDRSGRGQPRAVPSTHGQPI